MNSFPSHAAVESEQPDGAGNEQYYDNGDDMDQFDSFDSPSEPPQLPVSAAPAALYDRSEMTVGGRSIQLLPIAALLPQHHNVFP